MKDSHLADIDAAFDRLAESGKVFWEFDESDRLLWAMACLRHHAGANGFRCIADYDEQAGYGVTAYAVYALRELAMTEHADAANREWERLRANVLRGGVAIPGLDPRLGIDELIDIQNRISQCECDLFEFYEPSSDDMYFVSIWDSDFSQRVFHWIESCVNTNILRG